MKNLKSTIQKNIWVAIDEVCVTVIVTAKKTTIINERYLSQAGRLFVKEQVEKLNPATIVLSRQQRQVKRLPKNQTKSTLLSVKQSLNDRIKKCLNNKKLNNRVQNHLLGRYNKMKADFTY